MIDNCSGYDLNMQAHGAFAELVESLARAGSSSGILSLGPWGWPWFAGPAQVELTCPAQATLADMEIPACGFLSHFHGGRWRLENLDGCFLNVSKQCR